LRMMRALRLCCFLSRALQMKSMPTPPATLDEMAARRACMAFFLLRAGETSHTLPKDAHPPPPSGWRGRTRRLRRATGSPRRPQEQTTTTLPSSRRSTLHCGPRNQGALFPDRLPNRSLLVFVLRCAADRRPPSLYGVCARLGGSQHARARVRPPGRTIDMRVPVPRQRSSHRAGRPVRREAQARHDENRGQA
jgi:hypothetical protein